MRLIYWLIRSGWLALIIATLTIGFLASHGYYALAGFFSIWALLLIFKIAKDAN